MKKGSIWKKKTFTRLLAAAAACAVVAASVVKGSFGRSAANEKMDIAASGAKETVDGSILSAIDNMFTLHVEAAELMKKQPVPVSSLSQASGNDMSIDGSHANSWCLGSVEDNVIEYCFSMPLLCTGNNIEKVTYSINNGAFQIVQPQDESIIVDGQLFGRELNTDSIGGMDEEGDDLQDYETVLYRSFTLDYQKQSDPSTWINICNEVPDSEEAIHLLWGEDGHSPEKDCKAWRQTLGDTTITCTAQYADGTVQSADILVGAQVMTYAEAGDEVASIDPDSRNAFITFELQ